MEIRELNTFSFPAWLRTLFRSKYTVYLEEETVRLREELRRWQDAALAKEGLPPISAREIKPLPTVKSRPLPSQWKARIERITGARADEKETRPQA
jgi:hypothetical protein